MGHGALGYLSGRADARAPMLRHPAPRSREGGIGGLWPPYFKSRTPMQAPAMALARWKGRRPRGWPRRRTPPPPCFAWSPAPALRAGADKQTRSRGAIAPEPCARQRRKNRFAPGNGRGSSAPKGACQPLPPCRLARADCATLVCVRGGSALLRGALAFRRSAAALARANASAVGSAPVPAFPETRSSVCPEKWIPVFRKIIRQQKLAGVTRFDLSRVYRAPRRPVVVPAERWPGAARERMANPPAGTALAPLFRPAFPERRPR
jgi:hypothetical protein